MDLIIDFPSSKKKSTTTQFYDLSNMVIVAPFWLLSML